MNEPEIFSLSRDIQNHVEKFRKICTDIGLYGQILLESFDKTNTKILLSSKCAYDVGFSGQYDLVSNTIIIYSGLNEVGEQEIIDTIFHEIIHAIQANTSAATVASRILNITPHDALKMMFAEELDATAKENLFHLLCNNLEEHKFNLSDHNSRDFLVGSIRGQKFRSLCHNAGHSTNSAKLAKKNYINDILEQYEENIAAHQYPDQYIKFTDIDLWETANSLEFNSFGRTPSDINFKGRLAMNDSQWNRLRDIEHELKIHEKEIISFSDYLKDEDITREDFIRQARDHYLNDLYA